jgi:hypothetical protein
MPSRLRPPPGIGRTLRRWLTAWLDAYVPVFRRRRPPVGVELRAWLPGWLLRLVPALAVLGLSTLLDGGPLARFVLTLIALAVYVWPYGPAPAVAVVGCALLLATAPQPSDPRITAVLVAALPAIMQFSAVLGRAGLSARIELGAFVPGLPRYALIQLVVQPLALVGHWVAVLELPSGPPTLALVLLALLGIVVVSFGWLPRLRAGSPGSDPPQD